MKRKRISKLIAIALALTFMVGAVGPLGTLAAPASVEIEFLNPLGKIDMLDLQPLAIRTPWALDAQGHLTERKVLEVPTNGTQSPQIGVAMHLIDMFGKYGEYYEDAGIVLVTRTIGGNWGSNGYVSYDVYSNFADGLAASNIAALGEAVFPISNSYVPTYYTMPAAVPGTSLPTPATTERLLTEAGSPHIWTTSGEWNKAYSSHPNLNPVTGDAIGTVNWTGAIDVAIAGSAV